MATDVIPVPTLASDLSLLTNEALEKEDIGSLKPQTLKPPKMPDHSYSRVVMMKLKEHPSSKTRPVCLDLAYFTSKGKSPSMWDPEHWHASSKAGDKYEKETEKRGYKNDKAKDEESKVDEFILTPQRRSFVSGCHVTLPLAPPTAPVAVVAAPVEKEVRGSGVGVGAGVGRRVGSGRVGQDRENGRREWPERANSDRNGQVERERTDRGRGTRDFEDRRFQRDDRSDRRFNRDEFQRYDRNHGRRNHHQEEEPEWFSGGPVSQSDTIELKGFDEEDKRKKGRNEKEKEKTTPTPHPPQVVVEKNSHDSLPVAPLTNGKHSRPPSQSEPRPPSPPPPNGDESTGDFNMEDILKMEIPLGEDVLEVCSKSSRFSQWFGRQEERKSPTDLLQQLGLRQLGKPSAAPSATSAVPEVNLLSLLSRNKPIVMRAEQLEGDNAPSPPDMAAFQQLVAQLGGRDKKPQSQAHQPSIPVPQPPQPPVSSTDPRGLALMQLLGAKVSAPPVVGPAHPALRHAPTEEDILAGRIQPSCPLPSAQVLQQQQLNALASQQLQQRTMAPPLLSPTLQRPEALAMIRAVQNGEVSRQQLYHQLQQAALMRQRAPAPDPALSYLFFQNALEEQAKQQQLQLQAQMPAQPARIAMAFTPTSVIRKMTADKDVKQRHHASGASTPDVTAERKNNCTPPPAHPSAEPSSKPSKPVGQPTGRTASQMANFVPPQAQGPTMLQQQQHQQQQQQQQRPVTKQEPAQGGNNFTDVAALLLEQQQQHQMLAAAMSAAAAAAAAHPQPRGMASSAQSSHGNLFRQAPPPTYIRPPPFSNVPPMYLPPQAPPPGVLSQQQRAANAQLQQLLRQHSVGTARGGLGGGNDLSRWFTPELLSVGGVGGVAHGRQGLSGHKVLSLEELERQQAAMPH